MPQIIRPPGKRRGLLGRHKGRLTRFGPGAPVRDGGQLAASHTAEETAVGRRTELREMIPEEACQLGMNGHDAAFSLGPVLELPPIPRAPIIGPLAARIGRCAADVQLAPVLII